jgi:3-methyl-2-oxobutanoate hydroxymethyltransferase
MKEGGCHAVKLEGGAIHAELVQRLVSCGIPVMGHIGLLPQSVHQQGGFKVQGREAGGNKRLLEDALALQAAGAYAIVIEGVPAPIANEISAALTVPTIGIGAGPGCDGQVLVINDLLGMDESFQPKFVRRFETLAGKIRDAVGNYVTEVRNGTFPNADESFGLTSGAAPALALAEATPYASATKK